MVNRLIHLLKLVVKAIAKSVYHSSGRHNGTHLCESL